MDRYSYDARQLALRGLLPEESDVPYEDVPQIDPPQFAGTLASLVTPTPSPQRLITNIPQEPPRPQSLLSSLIVEPSAPQSQRFITNVLPSQSEQLPSQEGRSPAERKALLMNSLRNETTGKQYALPTQPRSHEVHSDGPQILHTQNHHDGSQTVTKRVAGLDGFGRQTARVVQEFVPPPDYGRMKQQAEIENINAKTAEIERGEGGKDPEKVALFKMYQSMPDGADKDAFGRMIGASEGAGVKLKPGERYNSTTGEVELVKGSEGWRKQEAAKLKSGVEKQALSSSFSEVARRVSDLESKGYDAATGWWDAMAPVWMTINPSDKSDARSRIKNLQEYLQTKGLLDLRKSGVAPGSVTEREWSKFAAMIGNVDPELSDKAFGEEIARIKTVMEAFKPPADDGQIPPVGGGSLTPAEQSRLDELKAKYGR